MTDRDVYRPKQARGRKLEGRPGDRRHGAGETAERERGRQDAKGWVERELPGAWQSDGTTTDETRDAQTRDGPCNLRAHRGG